MIKTIASDKQTIVLGLGQTGVSCVRFLRNKGSLPVVMDSRVSPPGIESLKAEFPDLKCILGGFDRELLCACDELIVSPGIALAEPDIQAAIAAGVRVRGDIDVFAEHADAPIVAITGSNGKSTVTTLVGEMARQSGVKVGVGGNIGLPALDLLGKGHDLYVLELSSFQLETTHALNAACAVLLNISEDHMDRYDGKLAYLQAKQRIFKGASHVVINDDEPLSQPLVTTGMKTSHYGLSGPDLKKFTIDDASGERMLVRGFDALMPVKNIALKGRHNVSNALAALAIGSAVNLRIEAMISTLESFAGLPHRCQWLRCLNGVDYINDSKGTNVGATLVALNSFGTECDGKVILIAGGEAKGADLAPLYQTVKSYVKQLVLIGRDAGLFETALSGATQMTRASDMHEAVRIAQSIAAAGDLVLLSPACASFDMFNDYQHRGDCFAAEVTAL